MKKLVLFGDSIFGRCGRDLIIQLESTLDNTFDIYNFATGGSDSNDIRKKSEFISTLPLDVVVISVGLNDLAPWKRVETDVFASNITATINNFKEMRLLFLLPPAVDEGRQQAHYDVIRENSDIKRYGDILAKICDEHKITYLDVRPNEDYHIEDGVHLNQAGYDTLFRAVKEEIL